MFVSMPKLKLVFGLAFFFAALPVNHAQAVDDSVKLDVQFTSSGLASLKYGNADLLDSGHPELSRLKEASTTGSDKPFNRISESFDVTKLIDVQTYSWGKITIGYHPSADRLVMDITVTNTGKYALTDAGLEVLHLKFPATPTGTNWENHYDTNYQTPDEIPAIMADWGTARLALCNDNQDKFANFGFRALREQQGDHYAIQTWFDGKPPILPNTSRSTHLSIRLGGANSPGWAIAHDVCQSFAQKYPPELNWTDHRPIGSAFLASSQKGYEKNPRGWFLDPNLDTTTQEGRKAFRSQVMAYADQVISHCKMMDAQGVIVWDLEGQEMPHATSYLADPPMLAKVAPEMDEIANEFLKRFTDAGLRTGLTIRPTHVEPAPDGHGWSQVEVPNPIAMMDAKISYAEKRWGCTLFYIDSNVNFVRDPNDGHVLNDPAMAAADFETLASHHKGCLLMPEHQTARYWAYTAPYCEVDRGVFATPPQVREAYPNAFTVLKVVDGPSLDTVTEKLVAALHEGDIFLFRPWWDDPTTAQIKSIYEQAASRRSAPQ